MATGGVAFYLDQVKPGESAAQFINNNFFSKEGVLRYNENIVNLFPGMLPVGAPLGNRVVYGSALTVGLNLLLF